MMHQKVVIHGFAFCSLTRLVYSTWKNPKKFKKFRSLLFLSA